MGEPIGSGDIVGVVGEESAALASALSDLEATTTCGDVGSVLAADPAVVVAGGDAAVAALARHDAVPPILPVDADPGLCSIASAELSGAASGLEAGDWESLAHPILGVDVDGTHGIAVLDVLLVSERPARISAFEVRADGEDVANVRADGILLATPAGTATYARAAGGPSVVPGSDVLTVVPVAPFSTRRDRYVLPAGPVTVRVTREDETIEVLADGDLRTTVAPGRPVRVAPRGTIETVRLPESGSLLG